MGGEKAWQVAPDGRVLERNAFGAGAERFRCWSGTLSVLEWNVFGAGVERLIR